MKIFLVMKQYLSFNTRATCILFCLVFLVGLSQSSAQNISTVAGDATGGYSADGIPATSSELHNPTTVAKDAAGNIYIADYNNARVRMVNTSGIISTIAGTGVAGYNFDNVPATSAKLNQPNGVAVDAAGNIYIAEMAGDRIRKINTSGIITTIAGNGTGGNTGDGGPATGALVNHPSNLVVDGAGNIYISDWGNSEIRMISSTGIMTKLAGTGVGGYSGDGIATAMQLAAPYSVSLDALGNLYLSDENNDILRKINLTTGILTTIAGIHGTPGSGGDGGAATAATFNHPDGIVANAGQLYIADFGNNKIRVINLSTGIVTTAVGNGTAGFAGDGSPATSASVEIDGPAGVLLDPSGNLYIADFTNDRIREVGYNNHAPFFDSGHVKNITVCENGFFNVSPYLSITDSDVGQTESWSLYTNATAGTIYYGATPLSPGVTFATGTSDGGILSGPSGVTYVPAAGSVIPDSFVFRVNDGISIDSIKVIVSISSLPTALPISGPTSVCAGSTITLTDATGGGTWLSKNNSVATVTSGGIVTGITGGFNDTIDYIVSNTCGNDTVFTVITVNTAPGAITPSTGVSMCVGNFFDLADPTSGGTWSVSNSRATVSGTGVVTGVIAGLDTVSYTIGTCVATKVVTINGPVAALPRDPTICEGGTVSLTDASGGGSWSSASPGTATVSIGGTVTGVLAGTAVISYTVGSCSSLDTITVISGPAAISPATGTVCIGSSITYTDATGSGTWSVSNGHASMAGGIVTGISAGIDTLKYTVGTCFVTATVTVIAAPAAINPPGGVSVCIGSTTTLTDATGGGAWSSASPGTATVGTGGVVTGIAAGSTVISYSVSGCYSLKTVSVNGPASISPYDPSICSGGGTVSLTDGSSGGSWSSGAPGVATVSAGGLVTGVSAGIAPISYTIAGCSATDTITVLAGPGPLTPSGALTLCTATSSLLSDGTSGGSWSSSNPAVATVSAGGLVTAVSDGIVNISYSIGTCSAVKSVTVNGPAALSPYDPSICSGGGTITLIDASSGGSWSSGAPGIATISAVGLVTGVAAGIAPITYTLGSCSVYDTVNVIAGPAPITPSGAVTVCTGGTTLLSDGTSGGSWSSSAVGVATVAAGGLVTGVSAGTVTITYTAGTCYSVKQITVNSAPTALSPSSANICLGNTITFSDGVSGGTWSSSATAVATVAGGLVTSVAPGTTTITYTIGTCSVSAPVTVSVTPGAGSITGPSAVCIGSSITLSDATPGGTWSSSIPGIATVSGTGSVLGVSSGTVTISYTVINPCGSVSATATVNVQPAGVLPITGPSTVCAGTFINLADITTGGTWSASNATATVISTTGLVTGISSGTDTITYTVTNACGTSSATKVITVGAFLTAATISGGTSVCVGAHITLTDPAPGGVWSASNGSASVASGTVTGVTGGVDTISYTVTSSCGSAIATHVVTVNALPVAGSIIGPASLCIGTPATYTDAATGGSWSISNAHATILGTGVVTPVSAGTDTITYTVTNTCGTASITKIITIGASAGAGSITGASSVCSGTPITLTDAAPGGSWSASNGTATVSGTGVVNGVATGVDTISYSVTGSCGTAIATHIVTVNLVPAAVSITGPASLCMGSSTAYTDASTGGTWSISNSHASIDGTGNVTPVSPGTDTITYTVSNTCGTASTTKVITIGAFLTAGAIAGPTAVCVGGNITLTDGAPGGTWSSSNATATVGSTGIVTGMAGGVDTISYAVSSSCGTAIATYTIAVGASATAGTITGPTAVCQSSLITLSDAVPGGSWSSSNANATAAPGGIVTGITPGIDTISYTVTGPCGVGSATYVVTINSLPVPGTISGPASVCQGATITLTDATPGGLWSAANPNATIGSGSGIVTGVTGGTDVISYSITNACGTISATASVIINTLPAAGTITGSDSVCVGAAITLSDAVPGGSWSAGNGNATVSGGLVTGISGGTDPISYTLTNGCGSASAIQLVTVISATSGGVISGGSSVCVGSGITLTDAIPGGTWTISNAHGSLVGPGIIDGVTAGVDTVFYTATGTCGTGTSSKVITINPVPVVAAIDGPTSQCIGTVITLTDATTGGIWSSSTPAVATIGSSSGVASGITVGTTTTTYTVTNIFGCPTSVTSVDTVNLMTSTPAITGPSSVCPAASITLTNPLSGGSWSSSSTAIATVGASSGVVTGASSGTATISYMVSGTCGTSFVTKAVTVNPLPSVAAITGTASECPGSTATLADATPSGVWSSGSTAIATVGSSTGIITGITTGTAAISYTVTNTFGCSASATIMNTVNTAPAVAAITGITHECLGATTTFSDATPGGAWSSSNPSVATVSGAGLITGVSGGVVTITYSVGGTGCPGIALRPDTVYTIPVPTAITGATNVCVASSTTLAVASFGGIWSSSNTSIATITTTGVVTGFASGTDEIYYAVSNSCGSLTDSVMITVQTAPTAGAISGASSVCQSATITLTDAAAGGVWSSANSHASVSGGVVTGVSAGIDTIRYTVTNACGSVAAIKAISIGGLPYPGTISGYTSLCAGNSIALTESTSGGTWSSSNTSVATVAGGVVTGIAAGAATISYSVTNSCGTRSATHAVTVIANGLCNTMVNNTGSTPKELSLYPNPASNTLFIDAPQKVNVRITSLDGKVVIAQIDATEINITPLANGMYLVMIYDTNNELLKTAKFAKIQ